MSANRAQFLGEIPDAVRNEVEKYLPVIDDLAPPWCTRVWVQWRATCEGDEACKSCTMTRYEYRYATITLHGKWLDDSEESRKETIIHETMHLYVAPLSGYTRHLIAQLTEDGILSAITNEQCREYQESVVQDLAVLVMKLG